MVRTPQHLQSIIDAYPVSVVVIDEQKVIRYVNAAWRRFADQYGCQAHSFGIGLPYLQVCRKSKGRLGSAGRRIAKGIERLFSGAIEEFSHEYACGPAAKRLRFMSNGRCFAEGRTLARRVLLIHQSVAPAKRAIELIKRRESSLKKLLELTPFCPVGGRCQNVALHVCWPSSPGVAGISSCGVVRAEFLDYLACMPKIVSGQ